MRFYRWVKKWAERVAALRIPLYAGNSAFFLLLSLFPLMSILLAILQRTSLQEADVLRLLAQVSPAALMPLFEDLLDGLYDVQPVSLISISAVTVVWSSSKGDVQPPAGAERCRRRHRDARLSAPAPARHPLHARDAAGPRRHAPAQRLRKIAAPACQRGHAVFLVIVSNGIVTISA